MRTSFHHQPEAQHPNFPLFTSWQADYPIFRREADVHDRSGFDRLDRDSPKAVVSRLEIPQRSSVLAY